MRISFRSPSLLLVSGIFLFACQGDHLLPSMVEPAVSTVLQPPAKAGDALTIDKAGNVYASDYAGTGTANNGNGTVVYKISPDGKSTEFVTGLNGPAGSAFDADGAFFVSNFNDGTVTKVTPMGQKTTFASGLEGPVGLIIDAAGSIYVAVAGLTGPGTKVYKFSPSGQKTVFADLASLNGIALGGMAFDGQQNLYVSNFVNGRIIKITPAGVASLFVDMAKAGVPFSPPIGYVVFSNNRFYVTSIGGHQIYRISQDAVVTVLAGTGVAGGKDGTFSQSQFDGPNGIVATRTGDTLYVSEANARRLRRLVSVNR